MSPEQDEYLCKRYPKIFQNRNKTIQESCMAWGFECGSGWLQLIDCLCSEIQNHVDWKIKTIQDPEAANLLQVVADQVKEKFGSLRFYYSGGDEIVRGMVTLAEAISGKICSRCGSFCEPSTTNRWKSTICESCKQAPSL